MSRIEDVLPHVDPFCFREAAEAYDMDVGDLESFCERYAHGECFALAVAINRRHGWEIYALTDAEGCLIHAAVKTPDDILIDGYGAFLNPDDITSRYPDAEGMTWVLASLDEVMDAGNVDDDALEDASVMLDESWMTCVISAVFQRPPRPWATS